ncbi:DMT family transporter [Candidatus Uabimicrobium amorphum]|uniref:Membrane protein n=1 Tax=Uabimicrobium amorphum TaxID=2596890 RepID=A0A5S9F1J4_UABAM|nr:DMT family transporter [Candidatus Uabimicrobium amorphum]BBM82715.1 membrane protein [Candidatus Uabimicrobium amorphum]
MSATKNMIISTVFFAIMQVCVKAIKHIPVFEIIVFRSLVIIAICCVFFRRHRISPWGNNKRLLIARGVAGSIALLLFFYTLQHIPLAYATTIQYLSPIFTVIIAGVFLKEYATLSQWLFLAIAFLGIVCIQGFDVRVSLFMASIGVFSALMSATAYNIIRVLKDENPLVIVFYFPFVASIIYMPLAIIYWETPQSKDWFFLIAAGVATYLAHTYMTKAYQEEKASNIVNLKYLGTVFSLVFGYVLFNESIVFMSFIGMLLIVFSALGTQLLRKPKSA